MTKNDEKIYLVFQSNTLAHVERLHEIVTDWVYLNQILQVSFLTIEANDKDVVKETLINDIKNISLETTWTCHIEGENLKAEFEFNEQRVVFDLLMDWSIFKKNQRIIEDFLNQLMITDGIYAYVRSYQEFLSHNTFRLVDYKKNVTEQLSGIRLMKSDQGEVIVDCSQFPGFDLMFRELCLMSCWKMWFSDKYYHLVPKQAFLEVQQVERIKELQADVLQITLYDSPQNWSLPVNMTFQKLFRAQLGFEQIEWINGVGSLTEPYTEYIRSPERIQMIQYQNDYMQPTVKTESSHFVSRIYNYQQNIYSENRQMGQLNYQAYFPFELASSKEHLAYWVLNPEYVLDGGLESFKFYIDYYLKAQAKLRHFTKHATVLMIYLPEQAFKNLPLKELEETLTKQNYKVLRSVFDYQFVIIKAGQSLSVEFREAKNLQKDAKKWQFPDDTLMKEDVEMKEKWYDFLEKLRQPKE